MEWAAYRVVSLLLPCEDEQWIRMQLLRDPDWFRVHQPEVGGTIYLDMGEMGVEGDAIVEAIGQCPDYVNQMVLAQRFGACVCAQWSYEYRGSWHPGRPTRMWVE